MEKEPFEIDKQVKKTQKEFRRGFVKGSCISLTIYSVYSLATAASHAAYSCSDPSNLPALADTDAIQPTLTNKPELKPLSEGSKGAVVGGASVICGSTLQSGDFYLGLACAMLLVIGGIVINRPQN